MALPHREYDLDEFDQKFALAEASEMRTLVLRYFDTITATERFAVAGAAAVAAFSVSALTPELESARSLISAMPFLILSLAGLRCLTIYWVLLAALRHIERIETAALVHPDLGFQRQYAARRNRINRAIEAVSAAYWVLACGAAAAFWYFANT